MMRLPSQGALDSMSIANRDALLELAARDVRDEIAGIKSGEITLTNGLMRRSALANARRRLKRIDEAVKTFA